MSDKTKIEWADATWNPITGCTKVSPGCDHCYASTLAERFRGTPDHYFEHGFDVQLRPDKLDQPLRWTKPRRVFVNSLSDLFHDDVPDEYIARIFAVMALAPQHRFMVLTKRHGRMRSLLNGERFKDEVLTQIAFAAAQHDLGWPPPQGYDWPLPNVWIGVTVEDQQRADLRIPALLDTPAAVRFLSCEPLLGPVNLARSWLGAKMDQGPCDPRVDWVICGGESGPDARPMHHDWARVLRDQCQAAGIPFHFKQWGEWVPEGQTPEETTIPARVLMDEATGCMRLGKKVAGRELDGRTWDEEPS